MSTTTSELLSLVLGKRDTLAPEEIAALEALPVRSVSFSHGETIIPQGPTPDESCLVVGGMALRAQATHKPETVVSALHIPGDFVDLHAFVLEQIDHAVMAQGPCKVQFIRREHLVEITDRFPHLTRLLWMLSLVDAKISRAWLTAAATLRAKERIGHLFCELYTRYEMIGFVDGDSFAMDLEQKDLARIFGFSRTHVNRSVQELRASGLLEWDRGRVRLPDFEGLQRISHFDPGYLELVKVRR